MAFFGKKKDNGDEGDTNDDVTQPSAFNPKKAKAFFDRAPTAHDSGSYEYAMQLWLQGLRQDPSSLEGFNGFLRSSEVFAVENPKKGVSKETKNLISAKGALGKFIDAMLDFGLKRHDAGAALKATECASKLGLNQQTKELGEHTMVLLRNSPKVKKDHYIKLLNAFEQAKVYGLAATAGDLAMQLDPSDGELQVRVRNMMAANTVSSGGYDDTSEGGFRKNIRDADKQLELEQQDSIAKSDSTRDQIVEKRKAEHEERPDDVPRMNAYATALLDRANKGDEALAISLFTKAYKASGQFRYRQSAGDVQIRLWSRKIAKLEKKLEANPDNAELAEKLEQGRKALTKLRMDELKLRVENYPTDLGLKYELGRVLYDQGLYNEAIEQFQEAQSEPKLRNNVLTLMGKSFLKLGGWEDAAIQTFRQALEGVNDKASDLGMDLRYSLMDALFDKAKKEEDLECATEAEQIAADIAIQSFSYRDVRDKRTEIREFMKSLKG